MGGKTSPKSINKYMAKTYDRINILVPKGRREEIRAAATAAGESMTQYILGAVEARMEQTEKAGQHSAVD